MGAISISPFYCLPAFMSEWYVLATQLNGAGRSLPSTKFWHLSWFQPSVGTHQWNRILRRILMDTINNHASLSALSDLSVWIFMPVSSEKMPWWIYFLDNDSTASFLLLSLIWNCWRRIRTQSMLRVPFRRGKLVHSVVYFFSSWLMESSNYQSIETSPRTLDQISFCPSILLWSWDKWVLVMGLQD